MEANIMKKEKPKKSSPAKSKKAQKVRKISDKMLKKIKGGRADFEERQSIGNCWGPCG